jgi:hypothetical protein
MSNDSGVSEELRRKLWAECALSPNYATSLPEETSEVLMTFFIVKSQS